MKYQSGGSMVGERRILREVYIANSLYTRFMKAGEVLRNARSKSGMSQLEVARRSGIAQSVISDYERGKREPGADTYSQLLEILGFTLELRARRRTKTPTLPDSKLARLVLRHRKEIIALARKHGARNVRVFARNERRWCAGVRQARPRCHDKSAARNAFAIRSTGSLLVARRKPCAVQSLVGASLSAQLAWSQDQVGR